MGRTREVKRAGDTGAWDGAWDERLLIFAGGDAVGWIDVKPRAPSTSGVAR